MNYVVSANIQTIHSKTSISLVKKIMQLIQNMSRHVLFYLVTLFRVGFFLSVNYLTVANLAKLGISTHC